MTWLVFFQIWPGFTPIAPPVPLYLHFVLGAVIVRLADAGNVAPRSLTVPGRPNRTARATLALSLWMVVLRAGASFNLSGGQTLLESITFDSGTRSLEIVVAMAIFSQVVVTAVVYDDWEEKELLTGTAPGETLAPPVPK